MLLPQKQLERYYCVLIVEAGQWSSSLIVVSKGGRGGVVAHVHLKICSHTMCERK